ncbi:hypothetical protein Srot_1181 [Segniliparus rotundus DSM 44985]|uniref:Uncharacterized protein n=1 Tax=Segniliparus rotundus (strain ATCC BAA-972 / CDC 1076 / CIP 108378 / DSM 44985 / JCM 13578) TaxID=640132 RepID=D6ZFC8_SEGRD|nr:hypothetical protein [Segniliparus rotundus]ADG97652.1 hypothetical protein Srot_1181 [Segniliparus rotundus DSM 44985]
MTTANTAEPDDPELVDPTPYRFDWDKAHGHVLLIEPLAKEDVETGQYGVKPAIRANVVDVEHPTGPERAPDVLVFGAGLVKNLEEHCGRGWIGGRLGKEGKARVLEPLTQAEKADALHKAGALLRRSE